jgi:hypothetical protein
MCPVARDPTPLKAIDFQFSSKELQHLGKVEYHLMGQMYQKTTDTTPSGAAPTDPSFYEDIGKFYTSTSVGHDQEKTTRLDKFFEAIGDRHSRLNPQHAARSLTIRPSAFPTVEEDLRDLEFLTLENGNGRVARSRSPYKHQDMQQSSGDHDYQSEDPREILRKNGIDPSTTDLKAMLQQYHLPIGQQAGELILNVPDNLLRFLYSQRKDRMNNPDLDCAMAAMELLGLRGPVINETPSNPLGLVLSFGNHYGSTVKHVLENEPDGKKYIEWLTTEKTQRDLPEIIAIANHVWPGLQHDAYKQARRGANRARRNRRGRKQAFRAHLDELVINPSARELSQCWRQSSESSSASTRSSWGGSFIQSAAQHRIPESDSS